MVRYILKLNLQVISAHLASFLAASEPVRLLTSMESILKHDLQVYVRGETASMDVFKQGEEDFPERRIWRNQIVKNLTEFANKDQSITDENFWNNPRGVWYGGHLRFRAHFADKLKVHKYYV